MTKEQNDSRELQLSMSRMHQRTLGGSQLWIRNVNDCLTICRGKSGTAEVESIEGEWTKQEIDMAIYLYKFTEAAQR